MNVPSPKSMPVWAYIILAVLVGGGLGNMLPYFEIWDKNEQSQIKYLQDELAEHKEQLKEVTRELLFIKEKLVQLTASSKDVPHPTWIKDDRLRVVHLNDAYERFFLTPIDVMRQDIDGTTDDYIWGSDEVNKLEKKVIMTRTSITKVVFRHSPISNIKEEWVVEIWPWYLGTQVIGVNGVAIKIPM